MTSWQKAIKYLAIAFALFLIVSIFGGIFGALGFVNDVFDSKDAVGELQTYAVSSDIHELKLEISAAKLRIATGDRLSVESNNPYLEVREQNGRLTVTETDRRYTNPSGEIQVNLYLPADFIFKKVDVQTGAGQVRVERLAAEVLSLELGAGQVQIESLNASREAKIVGGAGQVTVENGALQNLRLDMGVGAANLTLVGKADDYRIELDRGLGEATLDGERLSESTVRGNGANKIDIDGGVGAIRIAFEAPAAA